MISIERINTIMSFMEQTEALSAGNKNLRSTVSLSMGYGTLDLSIGIIFKDTYTDLIRERRNLVTSTDEELAQVMADTIETLKADKSEDEYKLAALEKEIAELKEKMNN